MHASRRPLPRALLPREKLFELKNLVRERRDDGVRRESERKLRDPNENDPLNPLAQRAQSAIPGTDC